MSMASMSRWQKIKKQESPPTFTPRSHFTSPFANHFGTLKFPSNVAIPTWAIQIQSSMIEWAKGTIFLVNKHRKNIFTNLQAFWIHLFRFMFRPEAVKWLLLWQLASHSAANHLREVGEVLEHHKEAWEVGPVIILAQYASNQHGKITKSRVIIRLWHPR